jgi:hypothetical protein
LGEAANKRLDRPGGQGVLLEPAVVVVYISVAVPPLIYGGYRLAHAWLHYRLCRHVFDATGDPEALDHVPRPGPPYREISSLPRRRNRPEHLQSE